MSTSFSASSLYLRKLASFYFCFSQHKNIIQPCRAFDISPYNFPLAIPFQNLAANLDYFPPAPCPSNNFLDFSRDCMRKSDLACIRLLCLLFLRHSYYAFSFFPFCFSFSFLFSLIFFSCHFIFLYYYLFEMHFLLFIFYFFSEITPRSFDISAIIFFDSPSSTIATEEQPSCKPAAAPNSVFVLTGMHGIFFSSHKTGRCMTTSSG